MEFTLFLKASSLDLPFKNTLSGRGRMGTLGRKGWTGEPIQQHLPDHVPSSSPPNPEPSGVHHVVLQVPLLSQYWWWQAPGRGKLQALGQWFSLPLATSLHTIYSKRMSDVQHSQAGLQSVSVENKGNFFREWKLFPF